MLAIVTAVVFADAAGDFLRHPAFLVVLGALLTCGLGVIVAVGRWVVSEVEALRNRTVTIEVQHVSIQEDVTEIKADVKAIRDYTTKNHR